MNGRAALEVIDRILARHQQPKLKNIQRAIVLQVWERRSYHSIAIELGYDSDYIKQVAAQLWKSLSELVGEKVTKGNIESILDRDRSACIVADWGEIIPGASCCAKDVSRFYGREDELQTLADWISDNHCRLVGIFGWGGVGKTVLSVKLAQQLAAQFRCVMWLSLRQAPTPGDLLNQILPILGVGIDRDINMAIDLLMQQLREKRCLAIFDNVESILQHGEESGKYLPGYEAYGRIFDRIADEHHQSCAILTGREKPHGITLREGLNLPVKSIQLAGLSIAAAQNLLADKGISAPKHRQQTLINYFNGNPLALKISATTIQNLFAGNIQAFLNQGMVVFGNLWDLLDRQFERLSCLEQQVMYLLAIYRVEIAPDLLHAKFLPSVTSRQLWNALELLRDRSAIETTERGLTQQPLMMEYVTARLLERIEEEILAGKLNLLKSYPLVAEPDRNCRRDAQIQAILQPLIDRLSPHFATRRQLELHLEQIMATLPDPGYAAKNLTDLCSHPNANSNSIKQHADRLALL